MWNIFKGIRRSDLTWESNEESDAKWRKHEKDKSPRNKTFKSI